MDNIMIITGGTSGLGLELLKEGINRGYFVCNLARNKEKMAELDSKYTENYKGFELVSKKHHYMKQKI